MRLKGYSGPAQPSPLRVGALNAGYRNLEVKCVGCGTHNTVEPTFTRRSKKRMRCKPCSEQPLQTRHLVRLRRSNVTTFHRPVCRCDCRPRLFGHELIAKDGRPGSGGPFCCTILTTLPPHSAMSARIHVFVTKEMKLPVMLVENVTGPPRLVGGHPDRPEARPAAYRRRPSLTPRIPLPVGSLDWS